MIIFISAGRKLSPTPRRLAPEVQAERDEGISDEDDPAELRILLELNEQEASILRQKVEDLERQNLESKKQVRELQDKLATTADKKSPFSSVGTASDKKLRALNDELEQLRKSIADKDKQIEKLQLSSSSSSQSGLNAKRQLDMIEQEAEVLRSKIASLESENERVQKENKRLQLLSLKKSSSTENGSLGELTKLKQSLAAVEEERDNLQTKLKRILQEGNAKLPPRVEIRVTDLTPKNQLKKWIEELDDEITEMRALMANSGAHTLKTLQSEKKSLEEELNKFKTKLSQAEADLREYKLPYQQTLRTLAPYEL